MKRRQDTPFERKMRIVGCGSTGCFSLFAVFLVIVVSCAPSTEREAQEATTPSPTASSTPSSDESEEPEGDPDPNPQDEDDDNGGGIAYYKNCTDARRSGAAPIYRGEPGYRSALDRNNDGVACE